MTFKVGKFSRKQLDAIKDSNAFLNIYHGAVRSGKSIAADIAFLNHVAQSEYDEFLIIAKTERTAYRNIVKDLQSMVAPREAPYNKVRAELTLLGKTIYIIGAKDEASEEKIRGLTVAGTLIDEGTVIPKSSFEMTLTRNSLPGSKIFLTTNPDSPAHFLYTDYITNKKLIEDGKVKEFHFELKDNLNLPADYIDTLSQFYKGVFFDRYVLGKWVQATGAIYSAFSESEHTYINTKIKEFDSYAVGVDYGIATSCCFLLFGIKEIDEEIHYFVLKQFYFDAKKEQRQRTDSDYALEMAKLIKGHENALIYCSHDAASLKIELKRHDMNVTTHKPDTLSDIRRIQGIIDEGRFHIHESCDILIKQIQGYVWDEKASNKGLEKPLKIEDHAVDAMRGPMCKANKRMKIYI